MNEINQTIIPMLPLYTKGVLLTIEVSIEASILATICGLFIASLRMVSPKFIKHIIDLYISFIRGTPVIIQIFVIYYALPTIGIDVPAFISGVIALGLNSTAYVAEIVRGGFNSFPRGQIEAARALGMSRLMTLKDIIIPQIFSIIMPQLTNEFINVVKMSPLLSVITVVELTRVGEQIVGRTYQAVAVYIFLACIYFAINATISCVTNRLEYRLAFKR